MDVFRSPQLGKVLAIIDHYVPDDEMFIKGRTDHYATLVEDIFGKSGEQASRRTFTADSIVQMPRSEDFRWMYRIFPSAGGLRISVIVASRANLAADAAVGADGEIDPWMKETFIVRVHGDAVLRARSGTRAAACAGIESRAKWM